MKMKSILIMVVTVVAGYFVAPVVGLPESNVAVVFAIGIFVGAIFQVFLALIAPCKTEENYSNVGGDSDSSQKTVYVGNLDFKTNEEKVRELFSQYGEVSSVRLMRDKETGRGRGFGFVEMSMTDAEKIIEEVDGLEFEGRTLKVNIANERKSRPRGRKNYR